MAMQTKLEAQENQVETADAVAADFDCDEPWNLFNVPMDSTILDGIISTPSEANAVPSSASNRPANPTDANPIEANPTDERPASPDVMSDAGLIPTSYLDRHPTAAVARALEVSDATAFRMRCGSRMIRGIQRLNDVSNILIDMPAPRPATKGGPDTALLDLAAVIRHSIHDLEDLAGWMEAVGRGMSTLQA